MRLRLLAAAAIVAAALAPGAPAAEGPGLRVEIDRDRVETVLGGRFSFTAAVTPLAGPTEPLVAHLVVVGLDPDVYVDPEDWSPERTMYLGPLAAGQPRVVTWTMQAVTHGSLAAFVIVLPQSRPEAPPAVSPALQLEVAKRTTIAAGGMLPLAIAVPAALGVLLVALRVRRRRTTA